MKKILFTQNAIVPFNLMVGTVLTTVAMSAHAATLPPVNSGTIMQQTQQGLVVPEASDFNIQFDGNALTETRSGGPQAVLRALRLTGLSVFTEAEVLLSLGDITDKSYDLAGYRALANTISQFYRDRGYPFAKAYIPAQSMKEGELRIDVLEGQYGRATVKSTKDIQVSGQGYLSSIMAGEVIESSKLERISLIMNDLPGYKALPSISPGEQPGTANLNVLLVPEELFSGDVTVDNQGSRYTGYNRVQTGVKRSRLWTLGDEITARAMYTDENMVFGYLGYSLPVMPNGLRANATYSRTEYSLGREYESLDAIGSSAVYSVGLSYPLIRSQLTNVNAKVNLERKELMDFYRSANSKLSKSVNSIPLALSFDTRDQYLGGGITYGALTLGIGNLSNDEDTVNSDGDFVKTTLDIARIQSLPAGFSLFVKGSAQQANKNLDSSEDLYLGGTNAVRAYPSGEAGINGGGDEGYYTQLELRYSINEYTPYVFYDAGRVSTYAKPTASLLTETRNLAGAGFGLKYQRGDWSADIFAAWKKVGGASVSDIYDDASPRVLGSLTYRFGGGQPANLDASELSDGIH
ncbi:ShlB/FhaC/HecB family hemolysin secretion/activation protein [Marinomonas sp. IMCC 4694]|uniref:ShlB/FhaC/HecB family hemolysin secretion/activation protein n=1 Tax=Marinomonas sp. IMCC 4694 TaxID=2605432 RepID=UPI0011E7E8DF|nr:ShlB/FhaC/HecB family hemolysin secretion/activation protein [Marinomonas sp. IMCC 4694]TYL47471.1 ShlB/FhaC/HecB family hemolysin secretion/activation protein [Marinomonas sp. IMCC 4694]